MPKDSNMILAWKNTAFLYINNAQYQRADSLANLVENLAQKINYPKGIYYSLIIRGSIATINSEIEKSLNLYLKSNEIAEKSLSKDFIVTSLSDIALAYRNLGNKDKTMQYALKAIEIQEKANLKKLNESPYGLVASVLKGYKKLPEAIKYATKALEISTKNKNLKGMGIQENRLGNIYDDMDSLHKALSHYLKGLDYARKANYLLLQTDLLVNVGRTYSNLGNPKKGEPYLLENEQLCIKLKSPVGLQTAYGVLGEYYWELKDLSNAKKYLNEAYKLNSEVDNISEKIYSTEILANYYADINDYKNAFKLIQESNVLKDSSAKIESEELSRDLLTKYETEKKETQIKLLNEETKNANFQKNAYLIGGLFTIILAGFIVFSLQNRNKLKYFEAQQNLRNRIAADLHDEIGSTLSSISILSEIVAFQQKKKEYKPEIMLQVSNDARDVIDKMDDIIWTINPENDDFYNLETRIKSFAIPLFESKDIDFKFDFSPELETIKIDMGKRRDIYLILKEAINNLVKYSQCKNATIKGSFVDNKLIISTIDDGIGFETNIESLRNGQKNMSVRASKIGADFKIESKIGHGTTVNLEIIL
jgi:signal transduction histidine kinase